MSKLKGHLLMLTKSYVIEKHGEDKYKEMLEYLKPESKAILSGILVSDEWYDIHLYQDMLDAFEKEFSKAELRDVAFYNAKKEMVILGIISKFMSIERLLKHVQVAWDRIYSEGKISFVSYDETKFIVKIEGIEFNDSMKTGLMYYLEAVWTELYHKKFISSCKVIDSTTNEFTFLILP